MSCVKGNLTSRAKIFDVQISFRRQKSDAEKLNILRVVPMTTLLDQAADFLYQVYILALQYKFLFHTGIEQVFSFSCGNSTGIFLFHLQPIFCPGIRWGKEASSAGFEPGSQSTNSVIRLILLHHRVNVNYYWRLLYHSVISLYKTRVWLGDSTPDLLQVGRSAERVACIVTWTTTAAVATAFMSLPEAPHEAPGHYRLPNLR